MDYLFIFIIILFMCVLDIEQYHSTSQDADSHEKFAQLIEKEVVSVIFSDGFKNNTNAAIYKTTTLKLRGMVILGDHCLY